MVGYWSISGHKLYVHWPECMVGGTCTWLIPIPEAWQAACDDDDSLFNLVYGG